MPKRIFMGKKDFQQLYLVKNFLKKRFKTKVIACRTIRGSNGVALSSRNYLLNKFELNKASELIRIITKLKKELKNKRNIKNFLDNKKKEIQKKLMVKIEYLELRTIKDLNLSNKINNSKIFLAYYIGDVRLIDNL
jgi:pantoate--beta-alanine ligase